jgi:SagB-type dehydrogenase family enzyme
VAVENYAEATSYVVSPDILLLLALCAEPATTAELEEHLRARGVDLTELKLEESLCDLEQAGLLVPCGPVGTTESTLEQDSSWTTWGPEAQYFHFVTKDAPYLELKADESAYVERIASSSQPALFKAYPDAPAILLPRTDPPPARDFVDVLLARRTIRRFSGETMQLSPLATSLRLSFGPQFFIDAGPFGALPFRAYANAGARSEAEVYLNVLDVAELEPGLYHYNSLDHSLEWLAPAVDRDTMSHLTYEQPMVSTANVAVFVTAVVERLAHKYVHPRTLRAMYCDAGHLGQTFALCATACGLGSNQTAAFRDREVEDLLHVDGVAETALYCPPSAGGSNLAGEEFGEDFGWLLPAEDLTGSAVDFAGDGPQVVGVGGDVGACGEVLA